MPDTKDVNKESQESSLENTAEENADSSKGDEDSSSDDNSQKQAVPYSRFKEKIDEVRKLQKEIKKSEVKTKEAVDETARQFQTYYESEISKMQRQAPKEEAYDEFDENREAKALVRGYEDQIKSLKKEIGSFGNSIRELREESADTKLKRGLDKLEKDYPGLDRTHVLAIKKMDPDMSLDEAAEKSHDYFSDLVTNRVNKMIEDKKKAAETKVMGGGSKSDAKPREPAKTIAEASERFAEHLEALDG